MCEIIFERWCEFGTDYFTVFAKYPNEKYLIGWKRHFVSSTLHYEDSTLHYEESLDGKNHFKCIKFVLTMDVEWSYQTFAG